MDGVDPTQIQALKTKAEGGDTLAQATLAQALIGPNPGEAFSWMEKAAASGLAEASYFLGVWLTEGISSERDLSKGYRHLKEAERKGLLLACHYTAYLKAKGIGQPPNWKGAIEDLKFLAEKQHPFALSQMGFLLRLSDQNLARDLGKEFLQAAAHLGNPQALTFFKIQNPDPKTISRQEIGKALEFLAEIPCPKINPRKEFSQKPLIAIFPEFIPTEVCDYLVSRSLPYLRPSKVIDHINQKFIEDQIRTSYEHRFLPSKADLVTHAVCKLIAEASDLSIDHQEILGVLRYQPGQEYKVHSDFLKSDIEGVNPEVKRAGQRAKTFLIYLNEEFTGGATYFPKLNLEVKPRKGEGLLFTNTTENGEESFLSLHAGLPVQTGEKFITTLWIRDQVYSFPKPHFKPGQ